MFSTNYQVNCSTNKTNFEINKQKCEKNNHITFSGKDKALGKFMTSVYTNRLGKYPDQHFAFDHNEMQVLSEFPQKAIEYCAKHCFKGEGIYANELDQKLVSAMKKIITGFYLRNKAPKVLDLLKEKKCGKYSMYSIGQLKELKSVIDRKESMQRSIDNFINSRMG